MIISESLPGIKSFLQPLRSSDARRAMLLRLMVGFIVHCGKMSASQAAGSIYTQARHRANVGRYLGHRHSVDAATLNRLERRMIRSQLRRKGQWFFDVDQTYVGHQGQHTENTFSRANYRTRPRKSQRHQKKWARRSCHGFVMGMLITPSGCRIPFFKSYLTDVYCRKHGHVYRTQTELAAELIGELPLPAETCVTVLGDTAFDAKIIRAACAARGYDWIVPLNPERVLEGPPKQRPKVSSLIGHLKASALVPVRLVPGKGPHAAQHRVARCRSESRTQARTFYVHGERRQVRNVGDVLLVFSTKEKPALNQVVKIQKVLMASCTSWSPRHVVQSYDLRWQIELMFKELKSTLGLDHYQIREFRKVERYVAACLVTFVYLEWYRLQRLASRSIGEQERLRCSSQRTYGICRLVRQHAEANDLAHIARSCRTKTGLRRLRRQLEHAIPAEYQTKRPGC